MGRQVGGEMGDRDARDQDMVRSEDNV
jgi:hypothetical protein